MLVKHPAKYSDAVLEVLGERLVGCKRVLDPFAGVGRLREVVNGAYLNEIEWEWACVGRASEVGNALYLPYADNVFDAICTSPTYGNRMADHHNAQDGRKRVTYKHVLGRDLHVDNSGAMQWGERYRAFHVLAWRESQRVLVGGGRLILNVSDHIRSGKRQPVTSWHIRTLEEMGFLVQELIMVETPRMRYGSNSQLRVGHESVVVLLNGNDN